MCPMRRRLWLLSVAPSPPWRVRHEPLIGTRIVGQHHGAVKRLPPQRYRPGHRAQLLGQIGAVGVAQHVPLPDAEGGANFGVVGRDLGRVVGAEIDALVLSHEAVVALADCPHPPIPRRIRAIPEASWVLAPKSLEAAISASGQLQLDHVLRSSRYPPF